MATAKKLPSGNWNVRLYVGKDEDGKHMIESFTAPTKREAERMAAAFDGDRKKRAADRKAGRIMLNDAIDAYIETCEAMGKSPATIKGYLSAQKELGFLLFMCIKDIRLQDMQKAVNEWAKKVSPKTIQNRISLITAVLNANSVLYNFRALQIPKKEDRDAVIPEDEEVRKLLAMFKESSSAMYMAVLLASTLGLRRSEICALDWQDIDFKARTLTVNKALVYDRDGELVVKSTKTKAGKRVLSVAPEVIAELTPHRQLSGRVVQITPNRITDNYIQARKTLHIPGRFHDLRHYMASVMAALNVPEKYAVEIMGHATPHMLQNVYQHTMKEKRASVFSSIETHTAQLISGEKISY